MIIDAGGEPIDADGGAGVVDVTAWLIVALDVFARWGVFRFLCTGRVLLGACEGEC